MTSKKTATSIASLGRVSGLALTIALGGAFGLAHPGAAEAKTTVDQLEQQIQELQSELQDLKAQQSAAQQQAVQASADAQAATQAAVAAAKAQSANAVTYDKAKGLKLGALNVKLGGYIAAEGYYRTRNSLSDIDDRFTAIPFGNAAAAHERQLGFTARQSRLTLGVTATPDQVTTLSAYLESDFYGAANTSNSKQSDSYVPRLRQAWAGYERADWGLHVFAGQMWSLATAEKKTLDPGNESVPGAIDNSIVAGYTYARQPGLRIAENFTPSLWAALSVENPQLDNAPTADQNTGVGGFTGVAISDETAPDVIAKVAADTAFGQFSVFGLARFFHNNYQPTVTHLYSQNVVGTGVGASAVATVVPKLLDFQAGFLYGDGTGRYGASQLADVAVGSSGSLSAVRNLQAIAGFVGHATPALDIYTYGGVENAYNDANGSYGNGHGGLTSIANNIGVTELTGSPLAATAYSPVVHRVDEATVGFWWKFYQGVAGTMQTGLQYALIREDAWRGTPGLGGLTNSNNPHAYENTTMVSFRYYPFQ